jgi:hypothetical protein
MTEADVAFLVGGQVQLDGARAVAARLDHSSIGFDGWSGEFAALEAINPRGHVPPVTAVRLARHRSSFRNWADDRRVLVVPQDVGMLQRVSIAAARTQGGRIALMPDGIVSTGRIRSRRSFGGTVDGADRLMAKVGVVAGRHGVMGSSAPDLCLSWGAGWDEAWTVNGAATIRDCGNPRADALAKIGQPSPELRVLLCSQPMWHPNLGGPSTARAWYSQLSALVATAPPGRLRVRLHPLERDRADSLGLDAETSALLTSGPLAEDLAWSSGVIGWVSSTLVEGAGCGRTVASVSVNAAADRIADGYAFTADPRVPRMAPGETLTWSRCTELLDDAKSMQGGMARDYLTCLGSASAACAAAIDDLVARPAS